MLISSDAHAAQSRAAGEATRFFDDIGCLAADPASRTESAQRYVRLASGGWASAESAWFAVSEDVKTPMDYGFLAFEQRDAAARADKAHQAHRWTELMTDAEAR